MPNTLRYQEALKYEHMTVAGTAIGRDGVAKLHSVSVNDPAATTLDVFNGPDTLSPLVAVVNCNNQGTLDYGGISLPSGIALRLNGTADITVVYE